MSQGWIELTWRVSPDDAPPSRRFGPRLDDFLAARVPLVSRMHLQSSVRSGSVSVDGRRAPPGFRLHAGAHVQARLDPGAVSAMTPESNPVEIVWEDEHLAVVLKPAGMLVHPTRGVKTGTLANALSGLWNRPGAAPVRPVFVHRLDKPTSGLIAVAKTRQAGAALAKSFASGRVEKRYLAWLDGVAAEDERPIDAPIARVSEQRPHWRAHPAGKPARTRLTVLRWTACQTLAELSPVTGRTNQLRIHCALIGHPIAGDDVYGARPAPRLYLHASSLAFPHPAGGRPLAFSSPPRGKGWREGVSM
jgi:23S rRNA pseudouridine1911/1915/1917 synthase